MSPSGEVGTRLCTEQTTLTTSGWIRHRYASWEEAGPKFSSVLANYPKVREHQQRKSYKHTQRCHKNIERRDVFTQNAVVYSSRIHALGRYVFIIHYHQPLHPTYAVQVYINGGRIWQGKATSSVWGFDSFQLVNTRVFPCHQDTSMPHSVHTPTAVGVSWSLRTRSSWT